MAFECIGIKLGSGHADIVSSFRSSADDPSCLRMQMRYGMSSYEVAKQVSAGWDSIDYEETEVITLASDLESEVNCY